MPIEECFDSLIARCSGPLSALKDLTTATIPYDHPLFSPSDGTLFLSSSAMGPPVTRFRAHPAEAWVAGVHSTAAPAPNAPVGDTPTDAPNSSKMVAHLTSALRDMDDFSVVHGRDAKRLRDGASEALTNVWYDRHYTTSQLVQKFNDSNTNSCEV
ncbi:hypothetical protein ANCDUO_03561 [Ancylostoma duodenale]|uniref:Uncharacterized protein n=1 Tax=Ancylostoma duodenale TaxID=51022 RepID=A0A0C2GX52_9BILA|nr:hypothetical protein ANCDUO_03561 [Ancylostoma duodenale]